MQRDEYIEAFFENIKSQLAEATVESKGRSVRYRDLVMTATWSNDLWDIRLDNHSAESVQRQYDPANARSPEAAACYFVDAFRRMTGQEPIPRPQLMRRFPRKGAENKST